RTLTWSDLRREVGAFAAALRACGVGEGDRVAAWMPHLPETVIALLGSAAIGAIFSSTSADFGSTGVIDRFGQIEPKVLLAADGYRYGGKWFPRLQQLQEIRTELPTVETVVVIAPAEVDLPDWAVRYEQFIAPHDTEPPRFTRLPFDHPVYILFSSGTTGQPKCIVHRSGGVLLKHLQEQQHHCDLRSGDRLFYFTTCGWMMWNWLAAGLGTGACIVLYDGQPFQPRPEALFDLIDETGITMFGVSAKFIDSVAKAGLRPKSSHRLDSMRTMTSTGSPLSAESFGFVYDAIKSDVHLASISGGTDICGCFVAGDPTLPVYAGEIQTAALGMAVEVWNDAGHAVRGQPGELVCTRPFPSMPTGFLGPNGHQRYLSAYFSQNPGVWTHGDYVQTTSNGGFVILGRSDATLNAGGVRIGTAELYRVVESFPEVAESVAIGQRRGSDTRVVLFVKMTEGNKLTPQLKEEIRRRLRQEESPRHVPAAIMEVADIPRTRSGKISELAVAAAVNGDPIRNLEALANPEALDLFRALEGSRS
ncbi:MAG: acetoacetate--CoA ligase, partial [Acidimicrobiia bacterium]